MSYLFRRDALQTANGTSSDAAVQANNATLIAWLVLNMWPSHLGLPLLIATILLSRSIKRHATLINMCITWMIPEIASSILLYTGHQTGPEPPYALCLAQASLLYGQPGLTSVSAFALVFQVFYVVRAAFSERDPEYNAKMRKWILLIIPYIAYFAFAAWTALVGFRNPASVSRDRRFFYCSVKDSTLTDSITAFSFAVLLVTTALEIYIGYITLKHWRVIRSDEMTEASGFDLNLILRVGIFGTWIFLGIGLSLVSIKAPQSAVPDMALATMGSAVVIVFGSQRDVLRVWFGPCFKRKSVDIDTRSITPNSLTFNDPGRKKSSKRTSSWYDRTSDSDNSSMYSGQTGHSKGESKKSLTSRDISPPVVRPDLTLSFPDFERFEVGRAV